VPIPVDHIRHYALMEVGVAEAVDAVLYRLASLELLPAESEWVGCTDDELQDIERAIDRPLSLAHRHFLRRVGHMAEARHDRVTGPLLTAVVVRLFQGSNVFWPYSQELTAWTDELLTEHGFAALAPDCVAVLVHQGYIAFWTVGRAADPPVWAFAEGQTATPEPAYESFTAWLLELGTEWAGIGVDG
jgi:hypothetical protein